MKKELQIQKQEVIEMTPDMVAILRLLQSLSPVDRLVADMWLRGYAAGARERETA